MIRRTIAIACFVAAFACTAAVASAASVPHWVWAPKPAEEIPAGKSVPVETGGALTFTVINTAAKKLTTKCTIEDKDVIENPLSGGPGVDTMTSFVISGCTGKAACSTGALISFQAVGLPWSSVLLAGPPILDEIKGVEISEQCNGAVLTTYTGVLTPEVKNNAGLKFNGPASGTLEDVLKQKLTIKGTDKMKGPPPKTKIGAM